MDCSPPGSSVHEIFQARILEWVAISFSRGSSPPRDRTRESPALQTDSLPAELQGKPSWDLRKRREASVTFRALISVSLDFRASSLKVSSQAGLPCPGRKTALWLEVCMWGGGWWWGEPRKVVSVMVMSSFPLLTPPQVKVSWGVLAQERVSCMAEIES